MKAEIEFSDVELRIGPHRLESMCEGVIEADDGIITEIRISGAPDIVCWRLHDAASLPGMIWRGMEPLLSRLYAEEIESTDTRGPVRRMHVSDFV